MECWTLKKLSVFQLNLKISQFKKLDDYILLQKRKINKLKQKRKNNEINENW